MKSRFNRKLQIAKSRFTKKVRTKEDQIKKHFLMERLEETLGKPKTEIKNLISDSLLATLSKVPFSIQKNH